MDDRRLLPGPGRPGGLGDGDVEREAAPENALAQQPFVPRAVDLGLEGGLRAWELRATEDKALTRADRVAGQRHAFEHERRIALHQVLVDVRTGVGAVSGG